MNHALLSELGAILFFLYACVYSYKKCELALFCFLIFDAWMFEWAILHMVHEVAYSNSFSIILGDVPLAIVFGWAVLLYGLYDTFRHSNTMFYSALRVAVLMVLLDFVLEPVAIYVGLWQWQHSIGYYGLPYNNFFGWFLYAFLVMFSLWKFHARKGLIKFIYMFSLITVPGLIIGLLWYRVPLAVQPVVWWGGFAGVFLYLLRQRNDISSKAVGPLLLFPLCLFLGSFVVTALQAQDFSGQQIGFSLLFFICWAWFMWRARV